MGGSTSGVVGTSGDRDWFRIALSAGGTYRFNLNGNSLGDPTLYLRDAAGTQLAFNDDANASLNSQINFTATTSGTYYLDAGAFSTGLGSYNLAVTTLGFVGTIGNDSIVGGIGDDSFLGSVGNDTLVGGSSGFDTVNYSALGGPVTLGAFGVLNKGANGIDRLVGIDSIVGSAGAGDTIDHSGAVSFGGVTVNGTDTNLNNGTVAVRGIGAPLPLSFNVSQFENVIGSIYDDSITGNQAANVLNGGSGNDTLNGDLGNDILNGGFGNDNLIGGLGIDILTGGAGNDAFIYTSIADSPSGFNRDVITDFELSFDRIDLSAIDANPFLLGNNAFTWTGFNGLINAAGQARFIQSGTNIVLQANTDANFGTFELEVQLNGLSTFASTNVIL